MRREKFTLGVSCSWKYSKSDWWWMFSLLSSGSEVPLNTQKTNVSLSGVFSPTHASSASPLFGMATWCLEAYGWTLGGFPGYFPERWNRKRANRFTGNETLLFSTLLLFIFLSKRAPFSKVLVTLNLRTRSHILKDLTLRNSSECFGLKTSPFCPFSPFYRLNFKTHMFEHGKQKQLFGQQKGKGRLGRMSIDPRPYQKERGSIFFLYHPEQVG